MLLIVNKKNSITSYIKQYWGKKYQNICILGDFNAIVDERFDYKRGKKGERGRKRFPEIFFQMAKELGLQDIWRETNTKSSQFTFYSNRHKSWSRIDMIWLF